MKMLSGNSLIYSLFLFLFIFKVSFSQNIAIGKWRDHLPYTSAIALAEGQGKVYCATEGGMFSYNKQDNAIERWTKVAGLSDVNISTLNFNSYNNTLVIAYVNGNIDLLVNNTIINIPDIKREQDLGNKTINSIHFINQYAYLACGFGIVMMDTDKKETKVTYKIGPNGSLVNVYDITSDNTNFYAATEDGVYTASLTNPKLISFGSWTKFSNLPKGIYNTIAYLDGKVYVNFSKWFTSGAWEQDTIYIYNTSSSIWGKLLKGSGTPVNENIRSLRVSNNKLVICLEWYVAVYDNTQTPVKTITNYGYTKGVRADQALTDQNNLVWIADNNYGLVKAVSDNNVEAIYPSGPHPGSARGMAVKDNKLWIVPGSNTAEWSNTGTPGAISSFIQGTWSTISGLQNGILMDSLYDILAVAIDPQNSNHVYAGSFKGGMLEFNNNTLIKQYNSTNSTLTECIPREGYWIGVSGLAFDQENNLWVSNSYAPNCLSVKKNDNSNSWATFNFTSFGITDGSSTGNIIVTASGQKWIPLPHPPSGIIVYQDGGTFAQPNSSNTRKLGTEAGKGALPSLGVMCLAEDNDGEIWVGTDKGLVVFYSPDALFSGDNADAQSILIEQDGHIQKLLETEIVNAIAVDGANRKWIGTKSSGVFLFSEDGQQELFHFTDKNSPLFSNEIIGIAIDDITGEVFFSTNEGILSYRGTATEGLEDYENVYAFPNPVREGYEGAIAIHGLVKDADVKITDISGALIYSTKAEGGQAIWNGKNFQGEKVHTGVYLVFCSNEDGSKTYVTKILFIN